MPTGVPEKSLLGPLLLYNNDLNLTIKRCKVHHFTDDTNLLCIYIYIYIFFQEKFQLNKRGD